MKRPVLPGIPLSHPLHGLIFIWLMALVSGHAIAATHADYMAKLAQAQQLSKRGEDQAASQIYEALIKQDPLQPQAYNNLAAIKARHGQLKQAQGLLEQALRSNPIYATVYENLSAIYVEMARDSYGKALHLATPQKNVMLRELSQPRTAPVEMAAADNIRSSLPDTTATPGPPASANASHVVTATAAGNHAAQAQAGASPANQVIARAQVTPATETTQAAPAAKATTATREMKPAATATDKNGKKAATALPAAGTQTAMTPTTTPQAAAVQPSPAVPVATLSRKPVPPPAASTPPPLLGPPMQTADASQADAPVTEPAAPTAFNKEEAITTLQGWAAAWSGKAVDLYLSFYADNYAPAGMSHKQWEAQRQQRLQEPKWIHVSLSDFQLGPVQDDAVRVRLIQKYQADNYHDTTRKLFRLRHTADGWRIVEEKTIAVLH